MDNLERFAAGDANAFEQLFREYQGEVYRWIIRLVRNPAAAEELTIETFWRMHRHHRRFDPRLSFGAWARRIATRAAIDYLRSAEHRRLAEPLVEVVAPPQADPVAAAETRRQIVEAFGGLPVRLRVAAQLALIDERSYQEIADALDISLSAVKMRVGRAVRKLRVHLARRGIRP